MGGASGDKVGDSVGIMVGDFVGVFIAATCAKPKKKNTAAVAKIISERTEFNINLYELINGLIDVRCYSVE